MSVATSHALNLHASYRVVKHLLEMTALDYHQRNPWLHLADACTLALRAKPHLWTVYREAMRAGLPSEFQKAKRRPAVWTARDRHWQAIEDLARTLVAASREPLTLRNAVVAVVQANPALYRRYAHAPRR